MPRRSVQKAWRHFQRSSLSTTPRFTRANEQEFRREQSRRVLRQLRFGLAVALILALAHLAWEWTEAGTRAGWLRALGPLAELAATTLALVLPRRLSIGAMARSTLMALVWQLTIAQAILQTPFHPAGEAFSAWWPDFLVVQLYVFGLSGLDARHALMAGGAVPVVAVASGWLAGQTTLQVLPMGFYLTVILVAGMVQMVRGETTERWHFLVRKRAAAHLWRAREQRLNARTAFDQVEQQRHAAELAREEADAQRCAAEEARHSAEIEQAKSLEAAALKERFFSAAYHDMQQPLSTISLFARALSRRLVGPTMDAARRDLQVIERSTSEIGTMFRGVREIWELGHYEPRLEAVRMRALLEELASAHGAAARSKGLELRVHHSRADDSWTWSDRMLLKRAVGNLLQNAIKYTRGGGVLLGVVRVGERLRVDVCDTGIGIPAEYAARVFEEYFQVPADRHGHPGGLGLGLSIVRRIESALPDHRLELSSRLGRGSRFSLYLPAAEPGTLYGTLARDAGTEGQFLRGKFVVVVDNEPALLGGLVGILSDAGCFTQGALGYDQVAEIFDSAERSPDLLITDYRLDDGRTGLDVIALMQKKLDWAEPVPVMLITGDLLSESTAKRLPPGSLLYRKPIEPASLLRQASTLMGLAGTPA